MTWRWSCDTEAKMVEVLLQNTPQGMGKAVDLLNQLPQDICAEMCQEVMKFLQYKIGAVGMDVFLQKIRTAGSEIDGKSVQSAINAVIYIFRSSGRLKLSAEELSKQLSASFQFSPNTVAVMKKAWAEQGSSLSSSEVAQLLNVGQLVDMQWKLGVAISSDSCRNLNTPYVAMRLTIAETSGQQITKSFELSISEFQSFSKQMKEMAAVLDTV